MTDVTIPTTARTSALRQPFRQVQLAALVVVAMLLPAYELAGGRPKLALALALLPLAVWEWTRLRASVILLGASLPLIQSVGGGSASLSIAVSDILLVFIGAGILMRAVASGSMPAVVALRPVAFPVAQYGAFMVLLLFAHSRLHDVVQTGQRFELLVLPLVVGVFAVLTNRHVQLLRAYVLATTALAAIWPLTDLGLQHNPAGQLMGNAILLIVGVPSLRRLAPCALVLVPGLLLTQSRGAIAATVLGIAVLALLQPSRGRVLLTRVLPLAVVGAAVFLLSPATIQNRLTTYSTQGRSVGYQTRAQYPVYLRQQYARDARRIIASHPWTGIGVGNYYSGDPGLGTETTDPHNVILLQAAEGGYLFALSFLLLIGAVTFVLYRLRRLELAPAAAAVVLATVAHGLVDIYWVRVTPVLGWLLVGMVCAIAFRGRAGALQHE